MNLLLLLSMIRFNDTFLFTVGTACFINGFFLDGGIGYFAVFGCGDYEVQGDEFYIKCKDEWTLCKKFLMLWSDNCPDVITGWNTKFFDIPYLVNRFRKILGEDEEVKAFIIDAGTF